MSDPVWVTKDAAGNIDGVFANPPLFATTQTTADDPDVVVFFNPPVTSVTPRQARLALLSAGLLDKVQAAVTAAGGATLITWDYASTFDRNDPLITQIGTALNMTPAQIDQLFATAATL